MLRAVVLGVVQGLTEFLPVSSSGHLVIVPYLLGWRQPQLAFDVALHIGTLIAVVGYFAADLWYLATRAVGIGVVEAGEVPRARRTIGLLGVGSVPAAAVGVTMEGHIEDVFGQPLAVAGFFLVTAALLYSAEVARRRRARQRIPSGVQDDDDIPASLDPGRDETTVELVDAVVIGVAQAAALLPGISRSGSTIAAGMFRGLTREAAARFSFLLSIPAVAGAAIVEVPTLVAGEIGDFSPAQVVVGALAAAVSGYWAIHYLLRLVTTEDLIGFSRYLVFLAAVVAAGFLWLGPASRL
ncbi:MAG: undecaprenyl-diphosphate phosphatase [Actinobacteria bacterium]|nr:undecaprenyl-diphosphate phosphatase [Actinomycetota bacterium]